MVKVSQHQAYMIPAGMSGKFNRQSIKWCMQSMMQKQPDCLRQVPEYYSNFPSDETASFSFNNLLLEVALNSQVNFSAEPLNCPRYLTIDVFSSFASCFYAELGGMEGIIAPLNCI